MFKYWLKTLFIVVVTAILIGCGGGGSSAPSSSSSSTGATGVGEKGPFVQNSSVIAYKLEDNGSRSTTKATTTTIDNLGKYKFENISWSGPTEIVMTGYYFNENSGQRSTKTASLSAIVSVTEGETVSVNINIFTDLEATRIKKLMPAPSFATAKNQAKGEIVDLFDLNLTSGTNLEDLDLTEGSSNSQANAELLRVSAAVSEDPDILNGLREGIKDGNVTNDSEGKSAFVRLGNLAEDVNLTEVANNLENNLSVSNPPEANDTNSTPTWADTTSGHTPVLEEIADVNVSEDSGAFTVDINATDEDPADTLTYEANSSNPSIATVGMIGNTLTITPLPNANGDVNITVKVTDANGLSDSQTFTVNIAPVNDAPVLSNVTLPAINEDSNGTTVTLSATDADDDNLTFSATSSDTNKATVGVSGTTLTITPLPNANGDVNITVTVSDGNGGTDSKTATLHINPVNDAPIANDDNITFPEDTSSGYIDVLANDSDPDGDSLTVILGGNPAGGTTTLNNNKILWIPGQNYYGKGSFTYQIIDGHGGTAIGTVNYIITPVNDAPVANDMNVSVNEDHNLTITLDASDVDGDSLTPIIVSTNHGTVSVVNDLNITYSPNLNYNGTDTFTYKVKDGNNTESSVKTVTINVIPENDPPVVPAGFEVNTTEDTNVSIHLIASDSEGDSLTYQIHPPVHGTLQGEAPDLTYVPNPNYFGDDSFTYVANDGHMDSTNVAEVVIHIAPVNDAPIANDDNATILEDTNVTINLVSNDVDKDNDTLTITALGVPANGVVVNNHNGTITYTPDSNFNGNESFSYTISDGNTTATANVNIIVTAVNDAPVANDDNVSVEEDNSTTINVLANDSDLEDDALSVESITSAIHGNANLDSSGNITYTPNPNYNGDDSFTYTVSDGNLTSTATVHITVTAVNDAPVANDSAINAAKNITYTGLLNATDVEGDSLTYQIVSDSNANGTVTITDANTGAFTYTPTSDFTGDANFTFKVNDGTVDSNTATVTIHVADRVVNVVANDDTVTINEDNNVTIDVLANDVSTYADDNSNASGTIVSAVSNSAHGTVTIDTTNYTIKYVPDANYNGQDTFTYTARSASGNEDNATVTINITSVNDAPVLDESNLQDHTIDEDTPPITVELNATDADIGDSLTFDANSSNPNIAAVSVTGHTLTITPQPNANGDVNITVTVSDGHGGIDSKTSTLHINPVDDPLIFTLSEDFVEVKPGEIKIVEANATDEDNNVTINLDDHPNFVELNGTQIVIHPTEDDIDYDGITSIIATNGNEQVTRYLHIHVNQVKLKAKEFRVPNGNYDANGSLPFNENAYFEAKYTSHNGLNVEKYVINATSVSIYKMLCDGNFTSDGTVPITKSGDELIVDENDDGTDDFKLKIVKELNETKLNQLYGADIFQSGDNGYKLMQKVLHETYEFHGDYQKNYTQGGNPTQFSSIAEFINTYKANGWFDGNSNSGITFAADSNASDGNGTLVEKNHDGNITDNSAGTWEIRDVNGTDILVTLPSNTNYHNLAFKMDNNGLLRGDYKANGEESVFFWINEDAKDDFVTYVKVNYNPSCDNNGSDNNGSDSNQSQKRYVGSANPGDFAKFKVNGNQLDFLVTGAVFGSISGTIPLTDVTGNGVFFDGDLGNGNHVKIAAADNLGIAVVPVDQEGNETVIMGLQVSEDDINESAIWNKQYIYAEIGEDNGQRYVEGHIISIDDDHSMTVYDTDGSSVDGCWKSAGNHIVVKIDDNGNWCQNNYADLNDTTADVRVVIRPSSNSGRSGFIADSVAGDFVGLGLEQRSININEMTGTFDAYSYDFNNGDEGFVQVDVTNDGTIVSYTLTPYDCSSIPCTLDTNHQQSGHIDMNQLCDGTQIDGVMCVQDPNGNGNDFIGFTDYESGYFMIMNEGMMVFGSKHQ